jgi:glucose-1-phosphate cytidylyltransferase
MKVAILAGGIGTRLSEETTVKPKPMVEIGGKPILWHIMNIYAAYGYKEFVIALGYKGEIIKDYLLNYHYHSRSLTVQLKTGEVTLHNHEGEDWIVHLLDTGSETNTGGRVKRVAEFIGGEPCMLTYGDGVSNVNIPKLLDFHRAQGKLATLTAVRPTARFGQMVVEDGRVVQFEEKPQIGEGWINGGFFVLQPEIVNYIPGDHTAWEYESLEHIAADGQLAAYQHDGFWQSMDTLRDVHLLEKLWQEGNAPWKIWS